MKKTLVIALAIVLCASLFVSCDSVFNKPRGTYFPLGANASSAPFREIKFGKSDIDAYVAGYGYISGTYTLSRGHLEVYWKGLGSERYKIELKTLGFWLDDKYLYESGSYGYF